MATTIEQVKRKDVAAPPAATDVPAAREVYLIPAVDVLEGPQGITLHADMPGVERSGLTVEVEGDTLARGYQPTADALEQLDTDRHLQCAQLLAHHGLRQAQQACRGRRAAGAHHGAENLDLARTELQIVHNTLQWVDHSYGIQIYRVAA